MGYFASADSFVGLRALNILMEVVPMMDKFLRRKLHMWEWCHLTCKCVKGFDDLSVLSLCLVRVDCKDVLNTVFKSHSAARSSSLASLLRILFPHDSIRMLQVFPLYLFEDPTTPYRQDQRLCWTQEAKTVYWCRGDTVDPTFKSGAAVLK